MAYETLPANPNWSRGGPRGARRQTRTYRPE